LEDLLDNYEHVEHKVARITELEHRGDFIVHEVMHLLIHTLIVPLDSEDIERLISALDDAIDKIEATAVRMVIFQIEAPTERAAPARPSDPQRRQRVASSDAEPAR